MSKHSIVQAFYAFFLFSSLLCTKKLETSINHQETDLKVRFRESVYIRIEEICKDFVILDFDTWFESYIPNFLDKNPFKPAFKTTADLISSVDNHITNLKQHLNQLEVTKQKLDKFAPLFLDAKISKINAEINALIHNKDVKNPFLEPETKTLIKNEYGHYIPDMIDEFNKKELSSDLISLIATPFKEDWDKKNVKEQDPITKKLEELAKPLRATLKLIIKTFSNTDPMVYNSLSPADRIRIQSFFDKFKFLLTPEEIYKEVMEGLVNTEKDLKPSIGFLNKKVFRNLNDKLNGFQSELERDQFLTIGEPEEDLEKIHQIAQPIFFSSNFNDEFVGNSDDLKLDNPLAINNEKPEETKKRKIAELNLILYKVYLFARLDGTLPKDKPMNNQEILKKLYDWAEKTDIFDEPVQLSDEEFSTNSEEPKNAGGKIQNRARFQRLLDSPTYKKHYIPLLYLICSKLKSCNFLKEIEGPAIAQKYKQFDNYDILNIHHDIADLVTPEIVKILSKKQAENDLLKLDNELDNIIDETTNELDEEDKKSFIGSRFGEFGIPEEDTDVSPNVDEGDQDPEDEGVRGINRKQLDEYSDIEPNDETIRPAEAIKNERKRQIIKRSTDDQVAKMEKIMDQFLKPNAKVTEEGKHLLDKLVSKADTAENPIKKAALRSILVKVISNRIKNNDKKLGITEKEIINNLNTNDIQKFLQKFDPSKLKGLKNFFFKTMIPQVSFKFIPVSNVEKKFYEHDMFFFIYKGGYEEVAQFIKTKPTNLEKNKVITRFNTERDTLANFYANGYTEAKRLVGDEAKLVIATFNDQALKNPVLLERMPAYDFFAHFIDFFAYFENVEIESKPVYGDPHRVYLNFYQFLASLRTTIAHDIPQPHDFALKNLESCLLYTEKINAITENKVHEVCNMSHRKYAEMYYFYKTYLIDTNKGTNINLRPYARRSFDTHTRVFINFAKDHAPFRKVLENKCEKGTEPICFVWKFFVSTLNYIQDEKQELKDLVKSFKAFENDKKTRPTKFIYLGIIEATFFNIYSGNVKQYSRVSGFLDQLAAEGLNLFNFEQKDLGDLVNYLKRSFKKLVFSQQESAATKMINTILNTKPNRENWQEDGLGSFFIYRDMIFPEYIKFFALLSSTKDNFKRIADFIIANNKGKSVFEMNNPKKHDRYMGLIDTMSTMKEDPERYKLLRNKFREWYSEDYNICMGDASRSLFKKGADISEPDVEHTLELLDDFDAEMETVENDEDEKFEKIQESFVENEKNQPEILTFETIHELTLDEKAVQFFEDKGFKIETENFITYETTMNEDTHGELDIGNFLFNNQFVSQEDIKQFQELSKTIVEQVHKNEAKSRAEGTLESGVKETHEESHKAPRTRGKGKKLI